MCRVVAAALGCLFILIGVGWFFTSAFDGMALGLTGAGMPSPLAKMYLSDGISPIILGLSVTGAGLIAWAVYLASEAIAPD